MRTTAAAAAAPDARRALRRARSQRRRSPPDRGRRGRTCARVRLQDRPYLLVREVDLGDFELRVLEQCDELVAVDLLLLDHGLRDLLHLVLVVLHQQVRVHVRLPDELRGEGTLRAVAEHAGDRIVVERAAEAATHDLHPDLLETLHGFVALFLLGAPSWP